MALKVFTVDDTKETAATLPIGVGSSIHYDVWSMSEGCTYISTVIMTKVGDFLKGNTDISRQVKELGKEQATANALNTAVSQHKERLEGIDSGLNPVIADIFAELCDRVSDLEYRVNSLES